MLDNYIEIFFAIAATCNSLLFIPQIIRLYKHKDSKQVALITFLGFNVINFAYLLHGIIRHDTILTITSGMSTLANTVVTLMILYYRFK